LRRELGEFRLTTTIRYQTFPRTRVPPPFVEKVVQAFRNHEPAISTSLNKGLDSNQVLQEIRDDLVSLGFRIEKGKVIAGKVRQPVLFGENGKIEVPYDVDGYHPDWKAVLEVEAGRGIMGNAIYRDLIRACVMAEVEYLVLAVANHYHYKSSNKETTSDDYDLALKQLHTLYGHDTFRLPYGLVLIGY
jgi:hypothetical protein